MLENKAPENKAPENKTVENTQEVANPMAETLLPDPWASDAASGEKPSPMNALLEDELKVNAAQAKGLWAHIRDFLALMWWRGPTGVEKPKRDPALLTGHD